jgi:hypothetical protein
MPYKSNTKQQMNTFKKSVDINKNKLKMLQDQQENLNKVIKRDERKYKLYEFMDKYNFTEEEVIEIFGLEQLEETPNEEEFSDVRGDIPDNAEDTSEDEYTEVSDSEGPINSSMCDEIVDLDFSQDGQEATKQMVERINKEQDLYIKEKKGHYSVKKNGREIIIENHKSLKYNRHDFGLITTMHETNNSSIVSNWDKFGRNQAKRRKFDYKGKNIEEVVQMIHDILS